MASSDGPSQPIAKAKGRPMLQWVGKRPLREVRSFPAQLVERFQPAAPEGAVASEVDWSDWPERYDRGGLLFHGDNKEVLAHLLANGFRGKVDLVYIDPPFDSGADYVRKVQLRGASGTVRLDGESATLGEQIQYTDIWANDSYLQFMYERLLLIRELMSPQGSIFLHADTNRNYLLRSLMDEVFGPDAFVNEVVWRRADAHNDPGRFGAIHDTIFYYGPADRQWTTSLIPLVSAKLETDAHYVWDPERGQYFRLGDLRGPGDRGPRYVYKGVDRHWKWSREKLETADRAGELYFTKNGIPFYRLYIENEEAPAQDLWMDIPQVKSGAEKTAYPTQKPEALLDRIVRASSNAGDIVLDCFVGSGTTAAVAQRLGRRWIGADINKGAIQTTEKRLASIIEDQVRAASTQQLSMEGSAIPAPAQLALTVHRVNDYDLQIQHNEAVNLAIEHLGAERTKADGFFHGTLGRELLHLVPFNHPCSLLDLQAVAQEVAQRPGEDRNIAVVALGRELACEPWLADYNRVRPINKIRLIELRTDPKYGKFFEHRPASARVRFEGDGDSVRVTVDDFVSPSIVERLSAQEGVLTPQIADWRAMVDSVFIDAAYDGEVFNVALADIPERRQDLVDGTYVVARPKGSAHPIAVRITDMLGEEVLILEPERSAP